MDARNAVKVAPVVLDTRDGKTVMLSTIPEEEALLIPQIAAARPFVDGFVYEQVESPIRATAHPSDGEIISRAREWLSGFVSNLYHNGIALPAIDFEQQAANLLAALDGKEGTSWAR